MTAEFSRVGVVVPARDEEATISSCVASIVEAARRLDLPVDIVVVCDGCVDATADRARDAGARVLTIDRRNVGAARAAGIAQLISSRGADGLWLATTDGDSLVPENWLTRMVQAGRTGWRYRDSSVSHDRGDLRVVHVRQGGLPVDLHGGLARCHGLVGVVFEERQ